MSVSGPSLEDLRDIRKSNREGETGMRTSRMMGRSLFGHLSSRVVLVGRQRLCKASLLKRRNQ